MSPVKSEQPADVSLLSLSNGRRGGRHYFFGMVSKVSNPLDGRHDQRAETDGAQARPRRSLERNLGGLDLEPEPKGIQLSLRVQNGGIVSGETTQKVEKGKTTTTMR